MARHRKHIIDIASAIILLALAALDATMAKNVFVSMTSDRTVAPHLYFLPVTQGESALLVLPGGITVLADAGSDAGIVDDLQKALPPGAPQYIDLAIISYPQAADCEGYQYILQHYQIGAFLYNGRSDDAHSAEWKQLTDAIAAKHVPLITLGAGDRIRYSNSAEIDILSPDAAFARSPDPADTAIVERVITPHFTALLAADIDVNVEDSLLASSVDLRANILKAPFPGVATASGDAFLRAVAPQTIVITPGVKGSASAPTKAMLARLASFTNAVIAQPKAGSFLLYNK